MYIICGLGNPGREYENTRHNMGFLTMDVLSSRLGISITKIKFKALIGEGRIGAEKVVLVKPQTFMNLSGEAVRPVTEFYKVEPSHLILVYDDVDLPTGALRVRPSGSAGTHNGMRSVIYQLQYDDFPRVRIGIGRNGIIPLDRYVIGNYTPQERPLLASAVSDAADACVAIVEHGVAEAMARYNRKEAPQEAQPSGDKR